MPSDIQHAFGLGFSVVLVNEGIYPVDKEVPCGC